MRFLRTDSFVLAIGNGVEMQPSNSARIISRVCYASLVSNSGQLLMVHSALSQFNNVEGGPSSILKSLLDAVGPQGTLIVPTFPHWGTVMKTMSPFDINNTPSAMGVLSELVRRDARACRSMHPTHPVAAIGPRAEDIIAGHETEPYAFGLNSPFGATLKRAAKS